MEKKRFWRKGAVLLGGAALYALLYAFGSQVDRTGATAAGAALPRFALAFPLALAALYALFAHVLPRLAFARAAQEKPFCVPFAWALLFCSFVPVFLIHYPGSFQYDCSDEVAQIAFGAYSQMHPMLHTLFVRLCISFYGVFQSMEKVAALCSAAQMALLALCFALVCASLSRSVSRKAARAALAFFMLYPAHWAFASNCTKDVLFAGCLALFFALCMEDAALGGLTRARRVGQIACGALSVLLRNNIVFAMALLAAALIWRRGFARRTALCTLAAVLLAQGAGSVMAWALDAQPGRMTEGLSLPIQQLAAARIQAADRLTAEDATQIDAFLMGDPDADTPEAHYAQYDPTLADPIKNRADHKPIEADLPGFFALWARVGAMCPREYADAFLNLALPSLYPYSAYRLSARYIEVGCNQALTAHYALEPIVQPRRFAPLREWLDTTFYLTGADDHPVLRWLFNTGFIYWVMLLFALYEVYCGRRARAAAMLLPVFFWVTYLLGPIMQGRYLYPFICMLPVMVLRPRTSDVQGQ